MTHRKSIATPPESDVDDEQLRVLLAAPLYLQEREASAERSEVSHSERENLMSISSLDPVVFVTCRAEMDFLRVLRLPRGTLHVTRARNVLHLASLDDTEHGHSFLTYTEPFLQRAQTLRRSTATAEWRIG